MHTHSLYDIKVLFQDLSSGDEKAFRQIFDLYKHRVQYVALKMLKDPIAAEEIVQEVFLKIWSNQSRFSTIIEPEDYLFTMVYNTIYTSLRKAASEERMLERLIDSLKEHPYIDGEDLIIAGETKEILDAAIESLPSQRKLIFRLSRQEGLSHEEIAQKLNLSSNTVRNQITEALHNIRTYLGRTAMSLFILLWNSY